MDWDSGLFWQGQKRRILDRKPGSCGESEEGYLKNQNDVDVLRRFTPAIESETKCTNQISGVRSVRRFRLRQEICRPAFGQSTKIGRELFRGHTDASV